MAPSADQVRSINYQEISQDPVMETSADMDTVATSGPSL